MKQGRVIGIAQLLKRTDIKTWASIDIPSYFLDILKIDKNRKVNYRRPLSKSVRLLTLISSEPKIHNLIACKKLPHSQSPIRR